MFLIISIELALIILIAMFLEVNTKIKLCASHVQVTSMRLLSCLIGWSQATETPLLPSVRTLIPLHDPLLGLEWEALGPFLHGAREVGVDPLSTYGVKI